ncbi:MAG: TonB-dependent receptor [Candidatus Solibacter usitatus]|nr:TonB-dependent receptor [Candidatus Solibacter usitatus]
MHTTFRIACLSGLLAISAWAQLTQGFISGTVTDPTGAVVPSVSILLTETSTGVTRRGTTNQAGVYRFVGLEPGVYTVDYSKAGFETLRAANVELKTAQEVVLNQALSLAGSAIAVTVESSTAGAQLSKATASVERRVEQNVLEALPLTSSRQVSEVAMLAPGVALTAGASGQLEGVESNFSGFTANGQRGSANSLLVDGVDVKDSQYSFAQTRHSPEGVAEVHIQTNAFSAEFGRQLGAKVSIVTRGGTNQVHGEVWDYFGANRLSAATSANKRFGLDAVRFSEHQTGGSLGGPIRKNRTFFFGLVETTQHAEGNTVNGIMTITIPTASGLATLSRVPLGSNQTPESRRAVLSTLSFLSEVHQEIRRYDSITTTPINGVPVEIGTARVPISRPFAKWNVQARVDHHLSRNDSFSYRFNRQQIDAPVAVDWQAFSNNQFGRRFASSADVDVQVHGLNYTRIFTPALVSQSRLAANRRTDRVVANDDSFGRTTIMGVANLGPNAFSPFIRPNDSYDLQDILTWTRGRHSLKIGLELLKINDVISSTKQHQWTFPNLAAFVNDLATSLTLRLKTSSEPFRSLRQNYFLQDDFKFRPNLTVNLGLRYQAANIPSGLFSAATPEIAQLGVPGRPRPDRNDWAPRFGFSYSPSPGGAFWKRLLGPGTTVLRGGFAVGYGILYESDGAGNTVGIVNNFPWNVTQVLDTPQIANRYPTGLAVNPAAPGASATATFENYPIDAKNPTTHFYSLSVQRELRGQYVVEAGYLGNRSYHLFQRVQRNPAPLTPEQAQLVIDSRTTGRIPSVAQRRLNPSWGSRLRLETIGNSNYNAGYVKVDRRLAKGLMVGANYTWSATLGDSEGANLEGNPRLDYSRLLIDRPHRLVIHYVWQTPGKRIWGGWRISGVSQWQSGRPFSITTGIDSNGNGTTADRPDYNPAGSIALDPVTGDWRSFTSPLSGGVFVTPLGTNRLPLLYSMPYGGNLGRNTFRGPSFALWSLSVAKPFAVTERIRVELRADTTNLFNHRNFGPPVSSMNDANFGLNDSNPQSRSILLAAKIRF